MLIIQKTPLKVVQERVSDLHFSESCDIIVSTDQERRLIMKYCISDIHGQKKALDAMLGRIEFKASDTLYILGDVIDRGNDGIAILQQIMQAPTMRLLLGNHELMMYRTLTADTAQDRMLYSIDWMHNGGSPTYAAFKRLDEQEQEQMLAFIARSPAELDITVAGQKYRLCHASPSCCYDRKSADREGMDMLEWLVWHRIYPEDKLPKAMQNKLVIFGHTPTRYFQSDKPQAVWHGEGRICIDCGAGAGAKANGRLACLRLDDMREFYVDVDEG